jgi:acetolactate synthase-1/3 small subunit
MGLIVKKTIVIQVQNEIGILTRISNVFSSRGFNIDSIAVGPTEVNGISKIIIVLPGDDQIIEQVGKQLQKLVQIIEIQDITNSNCVERELMLIRVQSTERNRTAILQVVEIFRANVVDFAEDSMTIEVTGYPGKIEAIKKMLQPFKIVEIVQTGKISIKRDSFSKEFEKSEF